MLSEQGARFKGSATTGHTSDQLLPEAGGGVVEVGVEVGEG